MKKFTYLLAGVACILSAKTANAALDAPIYFQEDFKTICEVSDYLPDTWVTYGNGKQVSKSYQPYFGTATDGPAYITFYLGSNGEYPTAACCTSFADGSAADQWLVTPAFEVEADKAVFTFTGVTMQSSINNIIEVYVSENGTAKEAFGTEPVWKGEVGFSLSGAKSQDFGINLTGYAGKKVNVAIVNKTKGGGLFGVTNIMAGEYAIRIDNQTPAVVAANEKAYLNLNVALYTPEISKGFVAELSTSNGMTDTYRTSRNFGQNNSITSQFFEFKNPISISEPGSVDYTITITPSYDGAAPTVLTGMVALPYETFPAVAVVEEFTATDCTFCPGGMAMMNYLKDLYKDTNKFYGIALHDYGVMFFDPMGADCKEYFAAAYKNQGFPSATLNRTSTRAFEPSTLMSFVNTVANTVKESSFAKAEVKKVAYDQKTQKVAVDIDVTTGYDANTAVYKAAVVCIENNVHQLTTDYNQVNYYAGMSDANIRSTCGEALVPYLQFASKAKNPIPAKDMYYQEVARGIWPSYSGVELQSTWKALEPNSTTINFDMPDFVDNWENTEMIAIVLDALTGRVVAAHAMHAADYTLEESGVESVKVANEATVLRAGNNLVVKNEGNFKVEVYGADGVCFGNFAGQNELTVDGSAFNGVVIVKVTAENGVKTAKLLW